MEHPNEPAPSPARELPGLALMEQLLEEFDRRRAALRAAELELAQLDELVIDGTIDYPLELVRHVQDCKREVAAITEVLTEMLRMGDGSAAGQIASHGIGQTTSHPVDA